MKARKRRRPRQSAAALFLAALAEHEAREDKREAEREQRIIDQMRVLVEGNMVELRAVVDKVTGYQTAVARAWSGENSRFDKLEARVAALESRDSTGTEK